MYKITWDKETGGVLLHSRIVEGTLGFSPRPVFWEELDLMKLNELGWKYPYCEEPLKWSPPHYIFVCSINDFFHKELLFAFVDINMETILNTPHHRCQIQTKRAEYFAVVAS